MPELKPCPFCNGKAIMQALNMHRKTNIVCVDCGASSKYGTPEEVKEAWNRRAENG